MGDTERIEAVVVKRGGDPKPKGAPAEKREVVVLSSQPLSTVDLKKAVARLAEEHKKLKPGVSLEVKDDKLGALEVTRTDGHFLFALYDHDFRLVTYDAQKHVIIGDSEEKANLILPQEGEDTMKAKKNARTEKKAAKKGAAKPETTKAKKEALTPVYVTHAGYDGKPEKVDKNVYCNEIKCAICGDKRYVKNADLFQVTKCKPCQKKKAGANLDKLRKSKSAQAARAGKKAKKG